MQTTHSLRSETTRKMEALEDRFASFRRRREEEHVKELAFLRAEIVELRMNLLDPARVSCNGDAGEEKVAVDPLMPPEGTSGSSEPLINAYRAIGAPCQDAQAVALHGLPTLPSDLIQNCVESRKVLRKDASVDKITIKEQHQVHTQLADPVLSLAAALSSSQRAAPHTVHKFLRARAR